MEGGGHGGPKTPPFSDNSLIQDRYVGMYLPIPDVFLIVTLLSHSTHDSTHDSADSEYLNSTGVPHVTFASVVSAGPEAAKERGKPPRRTLRYTQ